MKDTLKIAIQTKQDLYTNSYKITIILGTIQVLEKILYTKVSRIRQLTVGHYQTSTSKDHPTHSIWHHS